MWQYIIEYMCKTIVNWQNILIKFIINKTLILVPFCIIMLYYFILGNNDIVLNK